MGSYWWTSGAVHINLSGLWLPSHSKLPCCGSHYFWTEVKTPGNVKIIMKRALLALNLKYPLSHIIWNCTDAGPLTTNLVAALNHSCTWMFKKWKWSSFQLPVTFRMAQGGRSKEGSGGNGRVGSVKSGVVVGPGLPGERHKSQGTPGSVPEKSW